MDFRQQRFQEYLQKEQDLKQALTRPFEHLYEDIIQQALTFSYIAELDQGDYKTASTHAEGCLYLSLTCRTVRPSNVNNWIQNAVHCLDVIILHYIQKGLKEKIERPKTKSKGLVGEDRWPYHHFIDKGDDALRQTGWKFDAVYQDLNRTKHLKVTDKTTGEVKIVRPNANKILRRTIGSLALALKNLQEKFKTLYPASVIIKS